MFSTILPLQGDFFVTLKCKITLKANMTINNFYA